MLDKKLLNQIKIYALEMDWNAAFGGKSKGNRHLFRVSKIAGFLAKKEKANTKLCQMGGWLHDIGLVKGNQNHPQKGTKIAEEFLKKLKMPKHTRKKILHCIEAHEGTIRARSLEAKIVHDADVLDKVGLLGVVRHTWKLTNTKGKHWGVEKVLLQVKEYLEKRRSQLYTKSAQKIAGKFNKITKEFWRNKNLANKVGKEIIFLTKRGFITEQIAQVIIGKLPDKLAFSLKSQLDGEVLKTI